MLELCDISAEAVTLGSMVLDADAMQEARRIVCREDFHRPAHVMIFEAVCRLADTGAGVDLVTLRAAMNAGGTLARVGGIEYLAELVEGTPSAANARYYAGIVRDLSRRRQAVRLAGELAKAAQDRTQDAAAVVAHAAAALVELGAGRADRRAVTLGEGIKGVMERLKLPPPLKRGRKPKRKAT